MYFEVLGSLTVTGEEGNQVRLPGGRARVVLALLCADAGQVVSRDRLIDITWSGMPPATAAAQLHSLISGLRRAFGRDRKAIVTRPDGYLLHADTDDVDLARLRSLIARSRQCRDRGALDEAAAVMADAVALWRGRPFSGLDCLELTAIADLAEQDYVSALEDYARVELLRGNHAVLAPRLAEWVSAYPLREALRGSYIAALARSGRQAEAIATYHQLRQMLAEELGVDPGQDIQLQYQQVLAGHGGGTGKTSLLPGPGTGPAPARITVPAQLPAASADFTGRDEEVRALKAALADPGGSAPGPAIAVITGMAGVGKSALAVRVGHAVAAEFPDGQLYVNLAGLSDRPAGPAQVLARLLRDLGVTAGDVPDDPDECAGRFRSLLRGHRILVVLDDARDTAQVQPLLPGTPGCAVLVTSRAALADLPVTHRLDLGALREDDAYAMFARLAGRGRVDAEPGATARILHACAGVPLAIRIIGPGSPPGRAGCSSRSHAGWRPNEAG
jgi:DNA-binding SARP family transcriptional activator